MVGPLTPDARHRFVIAGIADDLPWGFTVSGFFRANSAKPFNTFVTTDLNGDGLNYDTPEANVNAERGDSFNQLDLRVSKFFQFGDTFRVEGIFELFNVFNSDNPAANRQGGNEINGDLNDPGFGTPEHLCG